MIEDSCKKSKIDNKHESALFDYVNSFVNDVNVTQSKITKLKYIMDIMLSAYDIEDDEVLDKLLDDKTVKNQPKTKEELKQIINDTIKEKGNECDLNFVDTGLITDMSGLFSDSTFNGDISKWNVSSVKYMTGMFFESNFNGDISKWDVSNVKDMSYMFCESNFKKDISKWNVSNVKDMREMFYGSKFNQDISKWDVSNVKNMSEMFVGSKFNRDISKWDVSNVEYMNTMFNNSKFNQDISNWDISNAENTEDMFKGCPLENKPEYQPKFEQ